MAIFNSFLLVYQRVLFYQHESFKPPGLTQNHCAPPTAFCEAPAFQGGERLAPPRATALHAAPRGGRVRADLHGLCDAAAALGDLAGEPGEPHGLVESGYEMRSSTMYVIYIWLIMVILYYKCYILHMIYIYMVIWINTYEHSIFNGMNIHKYQLF